MRNRSQAKSVLLPHARGIECKVGPAGMQRWLFPESGPWFLDWAEILQEQSLPQKLEITVQSVSYNPERWVIGVSKSKPCWYLMVRSLCVHHDGGVFLTAWSARGPHAHAVSDTRGSGSSVGFRMT